MKRAPEASAARVASSTERLFGHWIHVFNGTYRGRPFSLPSPAPEEMAHHRVERFAMEFAAFLRGEIAGAKQRYGFSIVNMDGTLVIFSINLCKRTYCLLPREVFSLPDTDGVPGILILHFLKTSLLNIGQNVAFKAFEFDDSHHLMECFFKATALALHSLHQTSHPWSVKSARKLSSGGPH